MSLSASGMCRTVRHLLIVFPGRLYGLGTLVNDSQRTRIAVIQGSDYWGDSGEKIKRTGPKPERTL